MVSDSWTAFVNDLAGKVGPVGAVAAIALSAGAAVWVVGGIWFLWRTR